MLGRPNSAVPLPIVSSDLGGDQRTNRDNSVVFDLVDEGPPTDIARDKDKMIGQAVWDNYLQKIGRKKRSKAPTKANRRRVPSSTRRSGSRR
jgi:hypothetical protein